ncbi:MAG TPA: cobalamin-dependent protein [Fibrobacteria bacterium]|nr:cobalamin-dependent protein [Fibrobacteria bacterium]
MPGIGIDMVDLAKRCRELCDKKQLDFDSFEEFCERILRAEVSTPPDVIGISISFSTAHKSTLRIAEACKRIWPNTPVIVGGMHATNSVDQLLENLAIDYVCRGEGESIIADLVMDPNKEIPGLIGRATANKKVSTPLIHALDTIPHPAWHLIPMDGYVFAVSRVRNIEKIEQDISATIISAMESMIRPSCCFRIPSGSVPIIWRRAFACPRRSVWRDVQRKRIKCINPRKAWFGMQGPWR